MPETAHIDYILKDTPNPSEYALISFVDTTTLKLRPADFPAENTTAYKDFVYRVPSIVEKYGEYLYREQDSSRTGNGFVGFVFTRATDSATSKTRIRHHRKQDDGTLRKITTNVVDNNTLPDADFGKDIDQQQVDATHSEVVIDEIVSGGTRTDYEFHPITGSPITTTREVTAQTSITQYPGQKVTSQQLRDNWMEKITRAVDTSSLDSFFEGEPCYIHNLPLPNAVLISVDIDWALAYGNGSFATTWEGTASGTAYSLSGNEQGSAEGSASLIPTIKPTYKHYEQQSYLGTSYCFFMRRPFTYAEMKAKIATGIGSGLSTWPIFKPESHSIALIGGKTAIQARASGAASLSYSASGTSKDLTQGTGDNYDKSVTKEEVILGPCIHDAITFTGHATKSQALSVTAAALWTGTGSPVFPSSTATKTATDSVEGVVSPFSLSATTPASVPNGGFYLISFEIEKLPDIGYSMIIARVLNASVLP